MQEPGNSAALDQAEPAEDTVLISSTMGDDLVILSPTSLYSLQLSANWKRRATGNAPQSIQYCPEATRNPDPFVRLIELGN
jgi:hypothetical protein